MGIFSLIALSSEWISGLPGARGRRTAFAPGVRAGKIGVSFATLSE